MLRKMDPSPSVPTPENSPQQVLPVPGEGGCSSYRGLLVEARGVALFGLQIALLSMMLPTIIGACGAIRLFNVVLGGDLSGVAFTKPMHEKPMHEDCILVLRLELELV